VYLDDSARLGLSVAHSLRLLVHGIVIGSLVGLSPACGWAGRARATGCIPAALSGAGAGIGPAAAGVLLCPSSYSAAVFLVALATFFPVAVLTWSGVANVSKSYYDVARTPGRIGMVPGAAVAIRPRCPRCLWACSWGWARRSRC
jgi:NitT/TauT family transport system permease protein